MAHARWLQALLLLAAGLAAAAGGTGGTGGGTGGGYWPSCPRLPNCARANRQCTRCLQCSPGFFERYGRCAACGGNCARCAPCQHGRDCVGGRRCSSCLPGFYLAPGAAGCQPCSGDDLPNCARCKACWPGTREPGCSPGGPGCVNGRRCTECAAGTSQRYGKGACQPCDLDGCARCESCYGQGRGCVEGRRCTRCAQRGAIVHPTTGRCIKPCWADPRCKAGACRRDGVCTACKDGFYVDDNNVCFPNDKLLEFGVEMKLSLLNEASTLLAGLAARAARSRSPSAAATARRAGALAASLQGLYTKYGCSAGFCGPSAPAGWFAPRPEDRAVLEASADEMAALMVEPGTRALMADEPGLVPEALRGPGDGATRADMCAKVRDMEVSAEAKAAACDESVPYPTAEALVSRDLSGGFNEQAPAVAQESLDLGNPVELARMRALAARAAAAKGLPPQASPRSCTNFDEFLKSVTALTVGYGCIDLSCQFPWVNLPLYWSLGIEGCLGGFTFDFATDVLVDCVGGDKCTNHTALTDTLLFNLMNTAEGSYIRAFGQLCFGFPELQRIWRYMGVGDPCFGPVLGWYFLKQQIYAELELSLIIARGFFGGRLQYVKEKGLCPWVAKKDRALYDSHLQCQDYCAWKGGSGAVYAGVQVKFLFFRKTWTFNLYSSPVPKCT